MTCSIPCFLIRTSVGSKSDMQKFSGSKADICHTSDVQEHAQNSCDLPGAVGFLDKTDFRQGPLNTAS